MAEQISVGNFVLRSRLRRKGVSLIISSSQLILINAIIFITLPDLEFVDMHEEHGVYAVNAASAFYASMMIVLVSINMMCNAPPKPTPKIEEAYMFSNKVPVIDAILELPNPLKVNTSLQFLAYLAWIWMAGCIIVSFYLYNLQDDPLSETQVPALLAAMLLIFQITYDFNDYWTQRSRFFEEEKPKDEETPEEPKDEETPEEPKDEETPEEPKEEDTPEEPKEEGTPEEPKEEDEPEDPKEEDEPEELKEVKLLQVTTGRRKSRKTKKKPKKKKKEMNLNDFVFPPF